MSERLAVSDFTGREWMQSEAQFLGIDGNAAACARFDRAVRDLLAGVGAKNPNAAKGITGFGYDTCAKLLSEPHAQSRRVLWVACANADVDLTSAERAALVDADAERFAFEYETSLQLAFMLLGDFLRLSAEEQAQERRSMHARVGRYPRGSDQHVAACDRLRDQLEELLALKPDQRIAVAIDYDADAPKFGWRKPDEQAND